MSSQLDVEVSSVFDGPYIHVQIKPNDIKTRPAAIVVAVVDTSGSMDVNCAENVSGVENVDISRLQLVQQSMKTIVNTLEEQDGLVLFNFSSNTKEVLDYTQMDSTGKQRATAAIDSLSSSGGTNIWNAVKRGVEKALTLQTSFPTATVQVMLLTDGEPNEHPPKPENTMLAELLATMPQRHFTLSTFSYGYSIDSALMDGMAALGCGVYGYCPDSSMVGTIFINFLAQTLNTLVQNVEVVIGEKKMVRTLCIGNPLNFLVQASDPNTLSVTVRFAGREVKLDGAKAAETKEQKEALLDQVFREKLITLIRNNLANASAGLAAVKELRAEIKALTMKTPFLAALATDLVDADASHGQVGKAFEPEFYNRWGKDYLRGFARFHELETCGNFKDGSLQLYQTPEFAATRTRINKIFMAMPPLQSRPQFSWPPATSSSSSSSSSYSPPPAVSQSTWYNYSGPCWDGDALVSLSNGRTKHARDVVKGDVLEAGGVVRCVVETRNDSPQSMAVRVGGALWTPWHPVKVDGAWVFPCDVAKQRLYDVPAWYDVVVSGDQRVRVGGVETVPLGHGLTDGVLAHPYFGTSAVVEALQKRPGFANGLVRAEGMVPERDDHGFVKSLF